jgi:hypothetical protein
MSKQQKRTTSSNTSAKDFSFGKFIPEKYQTPAALLLILILVLIFFSPVMFGDKTTNSGDIVQGKSIRAVATKDHDGSILWNPYIFCGMPAVITSGSPRWHDLTIATYSIASEIYTVFSKDFNARFTLNFLILGFSAFFFMRRFGASRGISLFVALATVFSSGIVVLFYIGHVSKLVSLAIIPFILMMIFKFQKEIKLIDVLLLIWGIHFLVFSAHVQIVFYFGLIALFYFIYFFIRAFALKDKFLLKQLAKSFGILAFAGIISMLMSFDNYSQILQYKPYSTRGTESITESHDTGSATQNNAYEYATNYSFSPGEILTFIVPSYYGFGRSTYNGPLTQTPDVEVSTYFGQMPMVDSAMYMGVIIFALGLFAVFVRWKEPVVQFFGIVAAIFIVLSFGKNLHVLYNLFYYYFPGFNNFRAPSMILHTVQIIFPILAGFGVMKIISLREEKNIKLEKVLKNTSIVFSVLFIISVLLNSTITSWFTARVNNHAAALGQTNEAQMLTALADYISTMFTNDLMIAMALLALTFGLSYAYVKLKVGKEMFVTALLVLALFDLFRISNRSSCYADTSKVNEQFREPEYISVIKKLNDKEPHRLLNLKQDGSLGTYSTNANFNVYFLQEDFSGYSAAKPRSYQDIMDVIGPANFTLWRMLGIKYIVTDRPFAMDGFTNIYQADKTFVFRYEKALPRIYFVNDVQEKSSVDFLNAVKNESFDPKKTAFVEKLDFKFDKADSTASAVITQYKDERVIANTNSNGNNYLFFGTTYLPGWKALVDGIETKIYKTNHGFQGIVVPHGKHTVDFIYEPKGFVFGKYLSLVLNIILLSSILAILFISNKKKNKKE